MASANAIARMDCTRIGVAAPGLRPTASEAFIPMKPTPRAAPSAARPTCRFPLISANIGINILFPFLFVAQRLPRLNTVKPPKFLMMRLAVRVFLIMRHDQHSENRGQEHEHQRLDDSH